MVAVGRSVRFRKRFGISVFSVSPGSLRGGAPQEFQEGGLRPPQLDICFGSVSVRYLCRFGRYCKKSYTKPTLVKPNEVLFLQTVAWDALCEYRASKGAPAQVAPKMILIQDGPYSNGPFFKKKHFE